MTMEMKMKKTQTNNVLLLLFISIFITFNVVPVAKSFQPIRRYGCSSSFTSTTSLSSSTVDKDTTITATASAVVIEKKDDVVATKTIKKKDKKPIYIKNEREKLARKPDFYRGAGVFKNVKREVTATMRKQFDSSLMNAMKENPNYCIEKDGVEFFLAKDHGFCWGVERSINLAYSAVETFPDSKVHITNELIHNPMVNDRLHLKNVNFIQKLQRTNDDDDTDPSSKNNNNNALLDANPNAKDFSDIKEGDVVMLPAFGATLEEMKELDSKNVKVVDTTCPWVAKVWNTVHTHQVRGLTSIIHGKYAHEETMATKSMAETYICVKNIDEAQYVSDFILNELQSDNDYDEEHKQRVRDEFMSKFSVACSAHFNPHQHLKKIGLANQTTMYKKETRAIGQLLQKTMMKTFGPDLINEHYYEFDTICDATQVRQDAVDELCSMTLDETNPITLDFILVVGGFDSSNTAHLLEIPHMRKVPSFHINTADCIKATNTITHRTVDGVVIEDELNFLTDSMLWDKEDDGTKTKKLLRVGVTSGASTPDKEVQDALGRIMMINKLKEEEENNEE